MDFLIEIDLKINKIFRYYELYGAKDYIGEPVTQTSHMIQAAMMAEKDGKPKTVILAALLHDIGHLIGFDDDINLETMGNVGVKNHERIGGAFLRYIDIPYPIPELVEGHVKAKRYLTHINPEYLNNLSPASRKSLEYQGGPMTKEEAEEFKNDELFEHYLSMRSYDDRAKELNIEINTLDYYKKMLSEVLLD